MKTLKLIENKKGNFNIKDFGLSIAGKDAQSPFNVSIVSSDNKLDIRLLAITGVEFLTRIDVQGDHFRRDIYSCSDFITVERKGSTAFFKTTDAFINAVKSLQQRGQVENTSLVDIVLFSSTGLFKLTPTHTPNNQDNAA